MGNKCGKAKVTNHKYGSVDPRHDSETDSDGSDFFQIVGDSLPPETPGISHDIRDTRSRLSSALDEIDARAEVVDHTKYTYPFENVILEGGGNKGMAYCGALKEMEEMGMMGQVKRCAGASAGAMTAALLCVGYSADEIREFLSQDLRKVFLDHSCGYFSLLPNLISSYGWNPGKKIFRWFGDRLYEQTQDRDITFMQVYEKFDKELCVVVTNLNQMTTEYCHPKSTPDMPINVAVRMSMAIPGMFSATQYKKFGHTDVYVDGGVLCNYPIHCYDGWWLSMDTEDSYFRKLQPLSHLYSLYEKSNRFGKWNDKSLGFLLYADDEQEMYRTALESRRGTKLPEFPKTKLSKKYKEDRKKQRKAEKEHSKVIRAVDAFMKVLRDHDIDRSNTITLEELTNAFEDKSTFTDNHAMILFGENLTAAEVFKKICDDNNQEATEPWLGKAHDKTPLPYQMKTMNGSGEQREIRYLDLVRFLDSIGVSVHARFVGYRRREVNNLTAFLDTLQAALITNVKRIYMEDRDLERTVGINTGYIGTTDFFLEPEDRDYLVEQGRRSFVAFLKYYVAKHNPPMKAETPTIAEEPTIPEENENETNAEAETDTKLESLTTTVIQDTDKHLAVLDSSSIQVLEIDNTKSK